MAMPIGGGGLSFQQAMAIVQSNPEQFAGIPPAIAAMQLVSQAQQTSPPPVQVTPDNPAPVQPGIEIEAPPPPPMPMPMPPPPMPPPPPAMAEDYRAQDGLRAALERGKQTADISGSEGDDVLMGAARKDTLNKAAPDAAAAPPPKSYNDLLEAAKTTAQGRQKGFEETAVDPAMAAILKARGERTDKELSEVDTDKKQQMWMAVMLAGAKMAQSQSPYFASALGAGLEAGALGLNKAKAEAAERKARLLDKKEDNAIAGITAKERAEDKARAKYKDVQAEAVADVKAPLDYEDAQLKIKAAQQLLELQPQRVQAELTNASANMLSSQAGMLRAKEDIRKGQVEGNIPTGAATALNAKLDYAGKLLAQANESGDDTMKSQAVTLGAAAIAEWNGYKRPGASSTPPAGAVRLVGKKG